MFHSDSWIARLCLYIICLNAVEGQKKNEESNYMERAEFSFGNRDTEMNNLQGGEGGGGENKVKGMPPTSVMTRLILIMVWRKLIRNPNTYSSLLGLTWSLVSFRYILLLFFNMLC